MVEQGTNGMVPKVAVQCVGMRRFRERWFALILAFTVALLSALPFALAARMAPAGTTFNGFLINPIDGFSYLAKMQQGIQGNWNLVLPYAPVPGPRAFLYVYYLLLGHISRIFSLAPILTLHLARIIGATLMYFCAYLLCERICTHRHVRWFAFGLMLFGSGLGWLGIFFTDLQSSDILIPESIPFLIAYSNPHFPLTAAALLTGILAALGDGWKVWVRVLLAVLSGWVLGAVLPFTFVSLVVSVGLWSALEIWGARKDLAGSGGRAQIGKMAVPLVACSLGALPWLLYDLRLSRMHPVISAWNLQNQTPSPHPIAYALGFAPLLLLGLFGIIREKPWRKREGRLLLVWIISGALLLYAPVDFQRRLSLGLAFPLAILAAWGWGSFSMHTARRRLFAVTVIAVMSLTNLLVIGAGLSGVVKGDPFVVYAGQELESYRWVSDNVPDHSLILAGEKSGNRLPAFASIRVLYGHPFETPGAEAQKALLTRLFQDEEEDLGPLHELGIGWVYFGEDERELGEPGWLTGLDLRWQKGSIRIYEVPPA